MIESSKWVYIIYMITNIRVYALNNQRNYCNLIVTHNIHTAMKSTNTCNLFIQGNNVINYVFAYLITCSYLFYITLTQN